MSDRNNDTPVLYTTGELAKLCGVTVRTVQYYDSRNILVPSELSEGGRRLYSEDDLRRLRVICFLRDAGLPINSIGELLNEDHPEQVIEVLLEEQEARLHQEQTELEHRLELLSGIRRELRSIRQFSLDSIADIALLMENKKKMKRLHMILILTGLPFTIAEWVAVILGFASGIWWPALVYLLLAIPYGIWVSRYYFQRVVYICPQCHEVFKPTLWEAFWANHTPTMRKLTCTRCGHHGFCVETYGGGSILRSC